VAGGRPSNRHIQEEACCGARRGAGRKMMRFKLKRGKSARRMDFKMARHYDGRIVTKKATRG
jgi:hypothetical protein